MATMLYYATCESLPGVYFEIGPTKLFAPCDDERIYPIPSSAVLLVTAPIEEPMAEDVRRTLELKLHIATTPTRVEH